MADLSDVNNALVSLISSTLYPNGTESPSACGIDARIFVGWPDPTLLDQDMQANPPTSQISIFPRQEERNTTRYMLELDELSRNVATLTLTAVGQTVVVGGTVPNPITTNPQNVVVFANGIPYPYAVQQNDTLVTIAAALAALIVVGVPGTTYTGAIVTLPLSARLGAVRVGVIGTSVEESRRQEKLFQISFWCASPQARDILAPFIDNLLARTQWLTLADQSAAHLVYRSSFQNDGLQKERVYRRDLFYHVEYPTIWTDVETAITQTVLNVSAEIASVPPAIPVATIYE